MRVIIQPNYDSTCYWVASYIKGRINAKKEGKFVLGLPTGSTPIGVYKRLVAFHNAGELSFSNVITFNMDEYVGLSPKHNQSYSYFMFTNLFMHVDIPDENINLLNGQANDLNKECSDFERKIANVGGIDLFLCGVGHDGHLAFNEPGSSLTSRTRLKTLCYDTIAANSRFFENAHEVPKQALTVGIQTIMDASEVIMMATGHAKATALKQCIEGSISSSFTCTAIQNHQKAIIISDEAATDELCVKTVRYYKSLQEHIEIFGNPITNWVSKIIKSDDKILITSPHPDDDVIGMGGTMQQFPVPENVTIAYMTNGDGGLKHNESPGSRIKEALSSVTALGFGKPNIIDVCMPFYATNERLVSKADIQHFESLLDKVKPTHLFVCADTDPNGTHRKCYDIIRNSALNSELTFIWLYTGAWGDVDNIGLTAPFQDVYISESLYKNKLLSIKLHISQNPPVIIGNDKRDFIQRSIDRNTHRIDPGRFIERFKIIDATKGMPKLGD